MEFNQLSQISTAILLATSFASTQAFAVTQDEAKLIAEQTAINKNLIPFDVLSVKITRVEVAKDQAGQPLIYMMQINNKGFVFVSAKDIKQPVLAYGKDGAEDFDLTNNPGISQWIEGQSQQLENVTLQASSSRSSKRSLSPASNKAAIEPVLPMTKTKWTQNGSYADQTPDNKLVGCVGTAISQFLRYHMYPWYGQGGEHKYSYPQYNQNEISVNYSSSNFYWPWMPNEITADTEDTHKREIAQISYKAGASVNALYGHDVTLAPLRNIAKALEKHFGYVTNGFEYKSEFTHEQWHEMAQGELSANRPFILTGVDPKIEVGHAWVVDGFDGEKYHMNWGWAGQLNGYFSIDVPEVRTYSFTQRMAMVRAVPERDLYEVEFCSDTAVLTAQSGEVSDGSQNWNYRLNADCKMLIQPENARSVTLSFDKFKTENRYDYVTVYDGDSTGATELGRFTGSSLPQTITSSGGSLLIHFTSDDVITEDGWSATYTGN